MKRGEALRIGASVVVEISGLGDGGGGEDFRAVADGFEIGGGDDEVGDLELGVFGADDDDSGRVGDSGGMEEESVDDTEDGAIRSDGEGEGEHGERGECGGSAEGAEGEASFAG